MKDVELFLWLTGVTALCACWLLTAIMRRRNRRAPVARFPRQGGTPDPDHDALADEDRSAAWFAEARRRSAGEHADLSAWRAARRNDFPSY